LPSARISCVAEKFATFGRRSTFEKRAFLDGQNATGACVARFDKRETQTSRKRRIASVERRLKNRLTEVYAQGSACER
jgi:hypothetical protein